MNINKNDIKPCSLKEAQAIMVLIMKEVHRICENNNIKYFLEGGTLLGAIRHKGFIPWDDDLDISMPREDYEKFIKIAPRELSSEFFMQTIDTDPYYNLYHIPLKIRHNGSVFVEEQEDNKRYRNGIYIDIFPIDRIPESKFKYRVQAKLSKFLLLMKMNISTRDAYSLKFFVRTGFQLLGRLISGKFIIKILAWTLKWNRESKSKIYTYGPELVWSNTYREEDLFPLRKVKFEEEEFWAPNNPDAILTNFYGNYMELPPEDQRITHAKFIGLKNP